MNKLYDIVLKNYREYQEYQLFLEEKKLELKDKRKEILNKLLVENAEKEEVEISEKIQEELFDLQTEEHIYNQDVQMIFYNLYKKVEVYLQLEDVMVLPKELTELCQDLAYLVPKTIFIVDKGKATEREKGKLKEILNPWHKEQQLKIFKASIESQVKQLISQTNTSDE